MERIWCVERVYRPGAFHSDQCRNTAKVEHRGKHYCGVHDPERIAKKRAETDARWAAERAAVNAKLAVKQHKLNTFDEVLAALVALYDRDTPENRAKALAAIDAARQPGEGESRG